MRYDQLSKLHPTHTDDVNAEQRHGWVSGDAHPGLGDEMHEFNLNMMGTAWDPRLSDLRTKGCEYPCWLLQPFVHCFTD